MPPAPGLHIRTIEPPTGGYQAAMHSSRSDEVELRMCEDGPLLVRGHVRVLGPDGEEVPRRRAIVALCRCGLTGRAPWCDGSHKVAARRADPKR